MNPYLRTALRTLAAGLALIAMLLGAVMLFASPDRFSGALLLLGGLLVLMRATVGRGWWRHLLRS